MSLGYAEADPTFDIEGVDAAHKLTLMSAIAFGVPVQFDKAHVEGITRLQAADIGYAAIRNTLAQLQLVDAPLPKPALRDVIAADAREGMLDLRGSIAICDDRDAVMLTVRARDAVTVVADD